MKKIIFSIIINVLTFFPLFAKCEQGLNVSWIDFAVEQKAAFRQQLEKANMPVKSEWMKADMKAAPFSANLKGVDKLVLITSGGPDGISFDHAIWANPKLIKADGSSVWLDELEPQYAVSGFGSPQMNKNAEGNPIRIEGEAFDHAIYCHANGILVYPLNDQYVRFEAKVGIDDASPYGTVYFEAMNIVPQTCSEKLLEQYPVEMEMLKFYLNGTSLDSWLISTDVSVEQKLVSSVIEQLDNPRFYKSQQEQIDSKNRPGAEDTQIRSYLKLYEEVLSVLNLQKELKWLNAEAIKLAYADMKASKKFDSSGYEKDYNRLMELVKKGFEGIYTRDITILENAREALLLKKKILLANPLLDMDKILVSHFNLGSNARSAMAPALGTQDNNWSNQQSAARTGFDAEIMELSNLRSEVKRRTIYKPENGASIADLKLHWDGNRIMFSSIMPDNRWNVFETTLESKGAKPVVETVEKDLEFFDGTYLPDGRVAVISNIGYQGVPCVEGWDPVGNMMLYDPENKNLRRLTFDQDANWNPTVMNNGRIMYTRWEYTDLTHYYSRFVMHMNPDGTENKALFGSGSMFPNSTFDVQPLPGHASAFVGIISGHHGVARSGRLILFDPTKARKGAEGMIQEIPYRNRPIETLVKDELVDGVWPQFVKPYPLNDKYFLVAAKLDSHALWGIYLVDVFDNVTLIASAEGEGFISPIPVRKVAVPPVIPDRVKLGDKEATVFIQDVYEGEGLRGVPKGTVKALRVLSYEYAYVKSPSNHYAQGIQSGWDIKRLLGIVPVEEDGSAIFKIPANMPIALQPLDEEGRAVQWMRSWFTGMPGEVVSCVGCHEDQNQIPIPKRVIASTKAPAKITVPEGGTRSFTFDLEIQPILDRACIACHNGENGGMDLRGGKKDKDMEFGTSYLALHPFVNRQGPEADMPVLVPYEYHASTSELVRLLKNGHHNVKLTDKEWRTLYNWIDFNAPDKGYFKANPLNGIDQIKRRQELGQKYADGVSVDWQGEIKAYADYLKKKGKITPEIPEPVLSPKEKNLRVKGWPFDGETVKEMLAGEREVRKEVEIAPGVRVVFVRIPAGKFVMGSYNGYPDNAPVSKVNIRKPFWMAEVEITNEQYKVIFPEHDSRYVDQFWKDHTRPGYLANLPEQPVIRVSWEEAMEYCKKLSEKTGLNITLPTEAQWEWACRAGSDYDFWYGDMNSDFSKKENMADAQLSNMAVGGIDPKPIAKTDFWFKYYNYIPKVESVDDGSMIQVDSKLYEANPFGLHSMHGNIAEWTRSEYLPYPYSEKSKVQSGYKVVRGGSYWERPKYSASYIRKAYYPWQRIKNVGFRIIIQD